MAREKWPEPVAETIRDLQDLVRYLDRTAERAISDQAHVIARSHANAAQRAIHRVEALAECVEELCGAADAIVQEPWRLDERKH